MIQRHRTRLLLLALLIALGFYMQVSGWLDVRLILELARGYTQYWWLIVVLILAQSVLFTFALAGSVFLWIAAPLYPPPVATFILAAGGTLGGLGAYYFSEYLTEEWVDKIRKSRSYRLLRAQENLYTLFAMRVFPGFPHSVVNYSSGILRARLSHFVIAAILGISIKSYIYARVIYGAASSFSPELLLDITIIGPLILLSAISLALVFIDHKKKKIERD
ncbi:MAG: VTT domain-containing protein [Gammaproteobacteria bacterium]|nr:VTT domain-containing protein [Gammaproteobacteria bacterium]